MLDNHDKWLFHCLSSMLMRWLSIMDKPQDSEALSLGRWLVFFIIIAGSIGGYHALDDAGWIPHTRTVDVYMKGEWLQGENRVCIGVPNWNIPNPHVELATLNCVPEALNELQPHNLNVRFWGKIDRPDLVRNQIMIGADFRWRCTHESESFVCRAIN
jgi:hypothetical protein